MSLFTLPHSGSEVEIKDFIPHKVAKAISSALFKNVKIGSMNVSATKQELVNEFGAKVMDEIENLPDKEHKARLQELKEKLVGGSMNLEGVSLDSMEKANMLRVLGMVIRIGKETKITEDFIDDLPEIDFKEIIDKITEVEKVPLGESKSAESKE